MIELIIAFFKNLLLIPDARPNEGGANELYSNLQKKLLLHFGEESVLDSFIYLTQDFKEDLMKKLSIYFLEIWYTIFRFFTPQQIMAPGEGQKTATEDIIA